MSIGFKEWAIVCDALGGGRQRLILRKGGIAEGRAGFRFQHDAFYLFPTWFHEQIANTRLPLETPLPPRVEGRVCISFFARVELAELVTSRSVVQALAPWHILADGIVNERFQYDDVTGINVALLRVYRLAEDWVFDDKPGYGGCRSWVTLPEPAPATMQPVIGDDEHAATLAQLRTILQQVE